MEQTLITTRHRTNLAKAFISSITVNSNNKVQSNTYLGIGRISAWPNVGLIVDASINFLPENTKTYNDVVSRLSNLKLITAADMKLVIPRIDWTACTAYVAYSNTASLFSYEQSKVKTGTVTSSIGSHTISGSGTLFSSELQTGYLIYLPGDPNSSIPPVYKEVVSITNDASLIVNSAFTSAYTSNSYSVISNTYPNYASSFYVRNSSDQVFKCISNNFGAISTTMPTISIDGNIPTDPNGIKTPDGYVWKYLYTIPGSFKQNFFTTEWMPIYEEERIVKNSVFGEITVYNIINGGSGYNANNPAGSVNIIKISGDGSNANITASVNSTGSIVGVNLINPGSNYTYANVSIQDVLGSYGSGAVIFPNIEPPTIRPIINTGVIQNGQYYGGHGGRIENELGATTVMVSVNLEPTSDGIPTLNADFNTTFKYRQISIIKDPLQINQQTTSYANSSILACYSKITTSTPNFVFNIGDTVFQSPGTTPDITKATFKATVIYWDNLDDIIWVNAVQGTLDRTIQLFLVGGGSGSQVTPVSITSSPYLPYSGDILYVNNRYPIERSTGQTEQINIILQF
jgi:hypothetical protein